MFLPVSVCRPHYHASWRDTRRAASWLRLSESARLSPPSSNVPSPIDGIGSVTRNERRNKESGRKRHQTTTDMEWNVHQNSSVVQKLCTRSDRTPLHQSGCHWLNLSNAKAEPCWKENTTNSPGQAVRRNNGCRTVIILPVARSKRRSDDNKLLCFVHVTIMVYFQPRSVFFSLGVVMGDRRGSSSRMLQLVRWKNVNNEQSENRAAMVVIRRTITTGTEWKRASSDNPSIVAKLTRYTISVDGFL